MKKIIIIYVIGVVLSWGMGFSYTDKYCNHKGFISYGDVVFISIMSTLSWIDVAALSILHLEQLDIWDKEVKLN